MLGVYEMRRVELLRDLFTWAYERSTKEYLTAKSSVVEPDVLRLTYRDAIRHIVKAVVQNPEQDPLALAACVLGVVGVVEDFHGLVTCMYSSVPVPKDGQPLFALTRVEIMSRLDG